MRIPLNSMYPVTPRDCLGLDLRDDLVDATVQFQFLWLGFFSGSGAGGSHVPSSALGQNNSCKEFSTEPTPPFTKVTPSCPQNQLHADMESAGSENLKPKHEPKRHAQTRTRALAEKPYIQEGPKFSGEPSWESWPCECPCCVLFGTLVGCSSCSASAAGCPALSRRVVHQDC